MKQVVRVAALAIVGMLAACSSAPPLPTESFPPQAAVTDLPDDDAPLPEAIARAKSRWVPVRWRDLPGFDGDAFHEAWNAWIRSCERPAAPWTELCPQVRRLAIASPAEQRAWLAHRHLAREGGQAVERALAKRPPLLPWFAVAFAVLVGVNSTGVLPKPLVSFGVDVSQACLVAAMAAIGMKTHLREIVTVGWRPVALMVAETVFLAILVIELLPLVAAAR